MSENWLHDDPRIVGAKRIAELTVENRQLESDNARLRTELSTAQQQLAEARALIKRHEDALQWICSGEYDCWFHSDDHTYRVNCSCHPGVHPIAIGDTPLAAIEAASKEEKNDTQV